MKIILQVKNTLNCSNPFDQNRYHVAFKRHNRFPCIFPIPSVVGLGFRGKMQVGYDVFGMARPPHPGIEPPTSYN